MKSSFMPEYTSELDLSTLSEQNISRLGREYTEKRQKILNGESDREFIKVDNSHEYPELLKIWLNHSIFTPEQKNAIALDMLEHENLHNISALDQNELGIQVEFGVDLIKNPNGSVGMTPAIRLLTPEVINMLTPEGEKIAIILFEYVVNPLIVNPEQKFSDADRDQVVRYLKLFRPFEEVYEALLMLLKKLPSDEVKIILDKLDNSEA
jgi:hypothetical protein